MITEAIVASVIAGSSVCSDHFENVSRFNPSDLSDYQQCVHIAHENHSGVIGKYLWVRTGYDFTYVPMKQIQSLGSAEARKNYVTAQVIANLQAMHAAEVEATIDQVVPELQEILDIYNITIEYNLDEIKTLEEFASALIQIIDGFTLEAENIRSEIQRLNGIIGGLRDSNTAAAIAAAGVLEAQRVNLQGQIDDLTAMLGVKDGRIAELEGQLREAESARQTAAANWGNSERRRAAVQRDLDAANETIKNLRAELRNWSVTQVGNILTVVGGDNIPFTYELLNGRELEDGHRSTVVVANGTITVTGEGAMTYELEDGHGSTVTTRGAFFADITGEHEGTYTRQITSIGYAAPFDPSSSATITFYYEGGQAVVAADGSGLAQAFIDRLADADDYARVTRELSAAETRVGELEGQLREANDEVDAKQDIIDARDDTIEGLEGRIEALETYIDDINIEVMGNDGRLYTVTVTPPGMGESPLYEVRLNWNLPSLPASGLPDADVPAVNNAGHNPSHTSADSAPGWGVAVDASTPTDPQYTVLHDNEQFGGTHVAEGAVRTEVLIRNAIQAAYADGFLDGYNEGYNEGYNQGYKDGYGDGFAAARRQ